MKLSSIKEASIPLYGDTSYRGDCRLEDDEVASFIYWVRHTHPKYALVTTHVKNESKRGHWSSRRDKSMGLVKGFADIIVMSTPPLAIEMKRRDHTKSKASDEQISHLKAVIDNGGMAVFCLGFEDAKLAFKDYLKYKGEL